MEKIKVENPEYTSCCILVDKEEIQQKYFEEFKKIAKDVFLISAFARTNLKDFINFISKIKIFIKIWLKKNNIFS